MRARDLELVSAWLGNPHVARWFLAGSSIEAEIDELRRAIESNEPTEPLMVLERTRAIGWCQWYLCKDYPEHAAGVGAKPEDVGLDYAIGDSARTGLGVGTVLITALIAHIRRRHPGAPMIADPDACNIASRRVLEKNGFILVAERPVPTERTNAPMAIYRLPQPAPAAVYG